MINIENYFEKGYEVTAVPQDLLPEFWMELHTTEWVVDSSATYKTMPSWYNVKKIYSDDQIRNISEKSYGAELIAQAPKTLWDLANKVINLSYFDTLRYYKPNHTIKQLHIWNGAEEIPYHTDAVDGGDTLILIYLTEELDWQEDWGGCLGLRKELSTGAEYETKVLPNNGTMVVINNTNPLMKHRVWKLVNRNVNRYTFGFGYSWQ